MRSARCGGPAALLALHTLTALCWVPQPARSQAEVRPSPPASRPTLYDPDAVTCQPAVIRSGFERQLQPFADQSQAVLERLRQVQLEITSASLRRCVDRGLLSPEQARAMAAELLQPQPQPSTRP